ncbi:hypothetical protein SBA2_450106 [Acidobacteriia bacterium SbA2]|nr:hypothetical protein SBA2_450106 [Acidobacteriia bacterium SbA2]
MAGPGFPWRPMDPAAAARAAATAQAPPRAVVEVAFPVAEAAFPPVRAATRAAALSAAVVVAAGTTEHW